jgi:hypothetical protein
MTLTRNRHELRARHYRAAPSARRMTAREPRSMAGTRRTSDPLGALLPDSPATPADCGSQQLRRMHPGSPGCIACRNRYPPTESIRCMLGLRSEHVPRRALVRAPCASIRRYVLLRQVGHAPGGAAHDGTFCAPGTRWDRPPRGAGIRWLPGSGLAAERCLVGSPDHLPRWSQSRRCLQGNRCDGESVRTNSRRSAMCRRPITAVRLGWHRSGLGAPTSRTTRRQRRPVMFVMEVIARLQDRALFASITSISCIMAGPKGRSDLRSPA